MDTRTTRVADFPPAALHGMLCDAEPVGRGQRPGTRTVGFPALATTAGPGLVVGSRDTQVTRDAALDHFRLVARAVGVPVNADFRRWLRGRAGRGGGERDDGRGTGIAGLSIEDSSGDDCRSSPRVRPVGETRRRRPRDRQSGTRSCSRDVGGVRLRAARIDETIRRLRAYAEAGADCLYAPRIDRLEQCRRSWPRWRPSR